MWPHFCTCEGTVLWVGTGESCNWCGLVCESLPENTAAMAQQAQSKAQRKRRRLTSEATRAH